MKMKQKPEKFFMGSGRDYPRGNVLLSDYQNPKFALGEFRLWLSESLNFSFESKIDDDGILHLWGTKREQATSLFKDWLSRNAIDYDQQEATASKRGTNDNDFHNVKITMIMFDL